MLLSLGISLAGSVPVAAYRPFVSTDAAVAGVRELEIELGLTALGRESNMGRRGVSAPALILNYGFIRNWELVGEFAVVHQEDSSVRDAAFFLKGVLREGVLQDHDGTSVAIEVGPLLPGTSESGVGVEGLFLVSRGDAGFVYHLNVGVWGAILERQIGHGLRLVAELEGERIEGLAHESSLLGGFIWEVHSVALDAGFRKRLSGASPGWQVTGGVTFSL